MSYYDPKSIKEDEVQYGFKALYVTPTKTSPAFIKAYPTTQTDSVMNPNSDTCNAGDLSTTTWS